MPKRHNRCDDKEDWVQYKLAAMTKWLLSPRVLRVVQSGNLGVVNWLVPGASPDRDYDGLYPEIAGYYLQFISIAALDLHRPGSIEPAIARDTAARVAAWLGEIGPKGDPITLQHRDMAESDWRNACLFVFDLAMIVRGLVATEARWPGLIAPALISRYADSAAKMISNGRLASHTMRAGALVDTIPAKWSTLPGVHHVKAAAALKSVSEAALAAAIETTLTDQADKLAQQGRSRLRELHPFLYLIEGWLILWGRSGDPAFLRKAQFAFTLVLGELDPDTGLLPPIAGDRQAAARSDVLAQALRAGLILERANAIDGELLGRWVIAAPRLKAALLDRVSPEGGVEFDTVGRHLNVWATLFGWQALRLSDQAEMFDSKYEASALI